METKLIYTYNNKSLKAYITMSTKKLELYRPSKGKDNSVAFPEKLKPSKTLLDMVFARVVVVGLFKQDNEWYRATKSKIKKLTAKQVKNIQNFHVEGGYDCEDHYTVEAREDYNLTYLLKDTDLKTLKIKFNEEPKDKDTLYIQQLLDEETMTYTQEVYLPEYGSKI